MPLQIRRGTDPERLLLAVPLAAGEPLWVTGENGGKLYIGDGTTLAKDLSAVINYNDTDAQRAAGQLLAGGSNTDISFSFNSLTNSLTSTVSISAFRQNVDMAGYTLSGTGNINIDGNISVTGSLVGNLQGNFKGSVSGDDSTVLIDGTNSTIVGPIISPSIQGPLTGNVVGNVVGNVEGILKGSVFGDDSTLLIDSENNVITNGGIRLAGNVLSIVSGSFDMQTSVTSGTAVSVSFETVANPTGNLLAGLANTQRFDLVSYKTDKNNPGDIESGDIFGALSFKGLQNSTGTESISFVGVAADTQGTISGTHIPTKFFILVQPETEAKAAALEYPFLTFDSRGRLAVNQQDAASECDINGILRLAPQSAAPGTAVEGMIAVADRVNWDPASVGSGGSYPAYFNGTSWSKMI